MFVSVSLKIITIFFYGTMMVRFGENEIAKETFYAGKKPIKVWDVNVDNIVISNLIETKTRSKYLMRILVLIMSKMSGYGKTFKVENKINELMSFCIDDEKLLEKCKAIWTKTEDLKNVYDDRYIKTKIRTYGDKVCTNFRGLNVPEDNIEYESFN